MDTQTLYDKMNKLYALVTKQKVIIGALITIILALLLLELSREDEFNWLLIFQNFGAFLIGTASVALLWELFGKRALFEEIVAAARLSSNIRDSGIEMFTLDYKEFDWKSLFDEANEIDLFFSYAESWRNNYVKQIKNFTRSDNTRMRVLLPNPDNSEIVKELSIRFDKTENEVKEKIEGAKNFFTEIFNDNKRGTDSVLNVLLVDKSPSYAIYRFDKMAIVTFFNQLGRTGEVPCFKLNAGGDLYSFTINEFEELAKNAKDAIDVNEPSLEENNVDKTD